MLRSAKLIAMATLLHVGVANAEIAHGGVITTLLVFDDAITTSAWSGVARSNVRFDFFYLSGGSVELAPREDLFITDVGIGVVTENVISPPHLISAVPEPETWVVMLGGLALAAFALGRRGKRIS